MNEEGMIPVECSDAQAKYSDQAVRFFICDRGVKFPGAGKFHVKLSPTRISIEVFAGFDGFKFTYGNLHLTQEAVDSIRPTRETAMPFEVTEALFRLPRRA